jgi:hypothetical protein
VGKGISFLICTLLSAEAIATDGVTLINQASVIAAGGFPHTISQSGSYKLSGSLINSTMVDAIIIAADDVTLDLNGFTITETASSSSAITDQGKAHSNVSVHDGVISQASIYGGTAALNLSACTGCFAERLRISTKGFGISLGNSALASTNVVVSTNVGNGYGIVTGHGSLVIGNTARGFGDGLIVGLHSTITSNTASDGQQGIYAYCPSNLVGNTALGNSDVNFNLNGGGCTQFNNNAP